MKLLNFSKSSCLALPCLALYGGYSTQSRVQPSSFKCHLYLSWASLVQVEPAYAVMLSRNLRFCRPLLFPVLGCHSVSLPVHLLSSLLAVCPAHLHLASFIFSIMSLTTVLFLVTEFLILSSSMIFSILLFIACCAVLSLCSRYLLLSKFHSHMSFWVLHIGWKLSFSGLKVVFFVTYDIFISAKAAPASFYSNKNFLSSVIFHLHCLAQALVATHFCYLIISGNLSWI